MPQPVLRVCGLGVWREETRILRNIDWAVHRGEHWVILGPNGCGKTSLLSALTGYMTPSEGHLCLLGQEYGRDDWSGLRTRVGIVGSAISRWIPEPETSEDILVGGRYGQIDFWGRARASDRRLARRLLGRVECAELADRPWVFLSQGERQRVLIARALMASPRLLILDEPCAGLDPVAREHFLQFLGRLGRSRSAPTLILVTHHVDEIVKPFNRALLLRAGQQVACGRLDEVLTSRNLSKVFGSRVRLKRVWNRYQLQVDRAPAVIA